MKPGYSKGLDIMMRSKFDKNTLKWGFVIYSNRIKLMESLVEYPRTELARQQAEWVIECFERAEGND